MHGNRYFMSFIDTSSKYAMLYFLPNRKNLLRHIIGAVRLVQQSMDMRHEY